MKKYANAFLKWITSILEVVIALILAVTIIIISAFVRPESVSKL